MSTAQLHTARVIFATTLAAALLCAVATPGFARPELWDLQCSSCHADDTPSCAGCHNHRGDLQAIPERHQYLPGERVEISFLGGTEPGWIRALLYDEHGNEIDRLTGPSQSGDDARGIADADSVAFPLRLVGRAPSLPGTYTWRAAYFGIFHIQNVTHEEEWIPLTVTVADPDSAFSDPSWGKIKAFYRR